MSTTRVSSHVGESDRKGGRGSADARSASGSPDSVANGQPEEAGVQTPPDLRHCTSTTPKSQVSAVAWTRLWDLLLSGESSVDPEDML